MRKSAGLAIVCNKKVLLAHPTNASWKHRHSIPKGEIDNGETKLETAIRETWEEVGLYYTPLEINKKEYKCEYSDKKGKVYKKIYYFVVEINEEIDTRLLKFQLDEVDQAAFYTYEEAMEIILPKQQSILEQLRNDTYL